MNSILRRAGYTVLGVLLLALCDTVSFSDEVGAAPPTFEAISRGKRGHTPFAA